MLYFIEHIYLILIKTIGRKFKIKVYEINIFSKALQDILHKVYHHFMTMTVQIVSYSEITLYVVMKTLFIRYHLVFLSC